MTRTSTTIPQTLILASCAASAGVHLGLVPSHIGEEPALAAAFVLAAIALVGIAAALDRGHTVVLAPAVLVLGLLLVGYALAALGGVGPLERETPDALGLATKAVELLGLGAVGFLLVHEQQGGKDEVTDNTQARSRSRRNRGGHGSHGLSERP
jgi:hypothetical protein